MSSQSSFSSIWRWFWPTCMAIAVIAHACGKKESSSNDNKSTTSTQDEGSNSGGGTTNPTGIAKDGQPGSTEPRPSACDPNLCREASVATVEGCPSVIGDKVPCDGFCFVDFSVENPIWNYEPPTSGPAYPKLSPSRQDNADSLKRATYVHNMAHRQGVLIYNCSDTNCNAQWMAEELRPRMGGANYITTADAKLQGSKFAALAWGYVYRFDDFDYAKLKCFFEQHTRTPATVSEYSYPH